MFKFLLFPFIFLFLYILNLIFMIILNKIYKNIKKPNN